MTMMNNIAKQNNDEPKKKVDGIASPKKLIAETDKDNKNKEK